MNHGTVPTYRPDIDGLRAVAIIAIVVFHTFPNLLPGGFIGVDVFFVISGYLITGLILKAQSATGFSLLIFYSRRIKRIFPAMILVLVFAFLWAGISCWQMSTGHWVNTSRPARDISPISSVLTFTRQNVVR